MPITRASELEDVPVIKTGTFIDKLSGIKGVPRQRITELYGDENVGKTTIGLQIVAGAQNEGAVCLWADVEHNFVAKYATSLGVDTKALSLARTETAEEMLDLIEAEIRTKKYDLVILDALGALSTRAEQEKQSGEKVIAGQASIVARFCRKLVPLLTFNNVAMVVINHSFVDLMSGAIKSAGGKKFSYHKRLSIRLKVNPMVALKSSGEKVGKVVVATVMKNHLANTEGMTTDVQLIFGRGFSMEADLLNDAIDKGLIQKQGNTYLFGSIKLGVGLAKARKALEADAALSAKVSDALKA